MLDDRLYHPTANHHRIIISINRVIELELVGAKHVVVDYIKSCIINEMIMMIRVSFFSLLLMQLRIELRIERESRCDVKEKGINESTNEEIKQEEEQEEQEK